MEGIINNFEELVERPPDVFKNKYGIDIIINTRAYKIDRFRKQVHTTDLQSGKETIFDYDSLVVATGARAVVPDLNGVNQEGVHVGLVIGLRAHNEVWPKVGIWLKEHS